jgi:hypothetical protein
VVPTPGALELGAQSGRQLVHTRLGGAVRDEARARERAADARHVHDVAVPSPGHPRQGLPAELRGGNEVDVDDRTQLGRGHRVERAGVVDAGVVHQHVDRAALVLDVTEQTVERERVSEVVRERCRALAPGGGDDGVEGRRAACHERDVRAAGEQDVDELPPDAPAGARHHDVRVAQLHGFLPDD